MFKVLMFSVLLISSNSFAYQLSQLNGTWKGMIKGYSITFTVSGIPEGLNQIGDSYTFQSQADADGFKSVMYCTLTKLEENKFDSVCRTSVGTYDHTYLRFLSLNTLEEEDLISGLGKIIEHRQN